MRLEFWKGLTWFKAHMKLALDLDRHNFIGMKVSKASFVKETIPIKK